MVSDEREVQSVDERPEKLACPHGGEALALVAGVALLGRVERTADACSHVLVTLVILLAQHSPQTDVGEVRVDESGAVIAETLQRLAWLGNGVADGVEGVAFGAVCTPLPRSVLLQQVQHGTCYGGELGAETGVVPQLPKNSAQLADVVGVRHRAGPSPWLLAG